MASLNQCNFIGNVGKIETRYMSNGDAVTNISLAVNENYKDKNGEKVEKTEWVNCVIYRKLAEIASQYVKVGAPLYLAGKLATRKWQDKEGKDRYTTEIIVNELQMIGGKQDGGQAVNAPQNKPESASKPSADFSGLDDDIPFN